MRRLLLFGSLLLVIILLISAVAVINRKEAIPEKHLEIVLRSVGHQLLLHAGDTASRVMPVKQKNGNTYQISFQNNFAFIPDTLINIVRRQFQKYQLPEAYMLSVMDCLRKETVFAYERTTGTGDLIPCTGRLPGKECYLIQVEFLKTGGYNFSFLWLLLVPLCFVGYYWRTRLRANETKDPVAENEGGIPLGNFRFYAEKHLLKFDNKAIDLSEKEARALKIFAGNLNQVVEREMLMKEIWEDEGIIVISRNVDVLVSKLRKKLSSDNTIKIINIHGRGYKFVIE